MLAETFRKQSWRWTLGRLCLTTALALGLVSGAQAATSFDVAGDSKYEVPKFEDEEEEEVVRQTEAAQKEIEEQQRAKAKAGRKEDGALAADQEKAKPEESAKERRKRRKEEEGKIEASKPVHLTADHAEYDNESGDFHASGHVVITQGKEVLKTEYAEGNLKSGDVWLRTGAQVQEKGMNATGAWGYYNINTGQGELEQIKGRSAKDKFAAPHAVIAEGKLVADQGGTMTRCPAVKEKPCLSIEAKTFEIIPRDKLIARDVKVYFKGRHIYSRDLWINDFNADKTEKIMPRVGWEGKTNGFYARLEYSKYFSPKDLLELNLTQFSRAKYKPQYIFTHDERNFRIGVFDGWEMEDDVWYKKEYELRAQYKNHHIIDGIPLSYDGYWHRGRWRREDAHYDSWHTEYAVFLRHDPIYFFNSKNTQLNLAVGRKWVKESRTGDTLKSDLQYYTLSQRITPKVTAWASYLRENRTSALFDIGQPDMAKELRTGLNYVMDSRNSFSIINRYDLEEHEKYETDFQWLHRFCCWALEFRYEREHFRDEEEGNFKVHYYFYW